MISSVLSHDIIITSSYRDLLGLVSYLPINIWSNKINCGIKTVLYNKIGDNFFLFYIIIIINLFNINGNNPELTYLILPNNIIIIINNNIFIYFPQLLPLTLFSIIYPKSAQLPFPTWLSNATPAPTPISALSHS